MPTRQDHIDRTHAQLLERLDELLDATADQWADHLATLHQFHNYSPNNQLLLAAQGADGPVASYRTWQKVTDINGDPCQVTKGAKALHVLAPIRRRTEITDPTTGDTDTELRVNGFKPVPVFHAGQLNVPPRLAPPVLPERLTGANAPSEWGHAVEAVLSQRGYTVSYVDEIDGHPGANGLTRFPAATQPGSVEIRNDLAPDQRLKTLLHEAGHVELHQPGTTPAGLTRDIAEIEAESVAFTIAGTLGLDTANYSLGYVAGWAQGNRDLIAATTTRVLTASNDLTEALEHHLDLDLTPTFDEIEETEIEPASVAEPAAEEPTNVVHLPVRPTPEPAAAHHPSTRGEEWKQAVTTAIEAGATSAAIAPMLAGRLTDSDTERLADPEISAHAYAELLAAAGVEDLATIQQALVADGHGHVTAAEARRSISRGPDIDHCTRPPSPVDSWEGSPPLGDARTPGQTTPAPVRTTPPPTHLASLPKTRPAMPLATPPEPDL